MLSAARTLRGTPTTQRRTVRNRIVTVRPSKTQRRTVQVTLSVARCATSMQVFTQVKVKTCIEVREGSAPRQGRQRSEQAALRDTQQKGWLARTQRAQPWQGGFWARDGG